MTQESTTPQPFTFQDAKGPSQGEDNHSFCPTCHRVMYSVWKYGPVTPAEHNKYFCVCDGEQTGEIKKRYVIYDVPDVEKHGA